MRVLAREGAKLADRVEEKQRRVSDRSRSMGRTPVAVTRTIRRRSGEAKAEVLALTKKTGALLEQSIAETRQLVVVARQRARGRGAQSKLKAAGQLEELADRCEKVASQIRQRVLTDTLDGDDDVIVDGDRGGERPNDQRGRW